MSEQALSAVETGSLLTLVLASLVVMGSPGPSTMSVTAVGAAFGLRRSLGYLSGIIVGTIAVLLAVAMGVVGVLFSMPQVAPAFVAASFVYILYLAFRIATAPPLSEHRGEIVAPSFAGGLLLAVANPKAYVAIAAVFAGTTPTAEARILDATFKTLSLAAMIVAIHVSWLLAGASFSRVLHDPASSRIANILLAATLVIMTGLAFIH